MGMKDLAAEVAQILKSASEVESISQPDGVPSNAENKLVRIIEGQIKGAGKVIAVDYPDPPGPRWSVLVDTEYAALKSYYAYQGAVRIQKGPRGWSIFKGD